jgi:hypothetical protein
LDDLVAVAWGLIEQDQDGRSNVAATKALTAARGKSASEHVVASTKRSSAVSTGASTASATFSPRTTVTLGALSVFVFVKFVIHCFSFVVKLTITIYRYRTFVKGYFPIPGKKQPSGSLDAPIGKTL